MRPGGSQLALLANGCGDPCGGVDQFDFSADGDGKLRGEETRNGMAICAGRGWLLCLQPVALVKRDVESCLSGRKGHPAKVLVALAARGFESL